MWAYLRGDGSEFKAMINEAIQDTKDFNEATGGAGEESKSFLDKLDIKKLSLWAAGLLSVKKAYDFLADSIGFFKEQELAEAKLGGLLEAKGSGALQEYKEFASGLQQVSTQGDEVTLKMLQQAEALGVSGEAAKRAIRNAVALGSAMDMNARSALRYTAMLEQGDTMMLQRYLPTLRKIEGQSERVTEAHKLIGDMFSVVGAEVDTLSGSADQLSNAWGDLKETVGSFVSGPAKELNKWSKDIVENLDSGLKVVKDFSGAFGSILQFAIQMPGAALFAVTNLYTETLDSAIGTTGTQTQGGRPPTFNPYSGDNGVRRNDLNIDFDEQFRLREAAVANQQLQRQRAAQERHSRGEFGMVKDAFNLGDDASSGLAGMFQNFDQDMQPLARGLDKVTGFFDKSNKAAKEHNKLLEEGKRLTEQFLTPQEEFNNKVEKYSELLASGAIGQDTFDRAMQDAKESLQDALGAESDKTNQMGTGLTGGVEGLAAGGQSAIVALQNSISFGRQEDPEKESIKNMDISLGEILTLLQNFNIVPAGLAQS